jgi:hypothetical protein
MPIENYVHIFVWNFNGIIEKKNRNIKIQQISLIWTCYFISHIMCITTFQFSYFLLHCLISIFNQQCWFWGLASIINMKALIFALNPVKKLFLTERRCRMTLRCFTIQSLLSNWFLIWYKDLYKLLLVHIYIQCSSSVSCCNSKSSGNLKPTIKKSIFWSQDEAGSWTTRVWFLISYFLTVECSWK